LKLIYLSTNAVFDGENAPYKEDANLCPINSYGIYKAACELAIRGSSTDWNIVRPLLMYGWPNPGQRNNWVPIWVDKLKKGEVCKVVYDTISQPLYDLDCANVIWKVINSGVNHETFNVAGADSLSLYDFAREVAEMIGADKHLIEPVPSSYFKALAPRPKDTSYCLDKIKSILGHSPVGIKDGLRDMLHGV
jgi:dTDP-4-dehydrorhamnose reductase